jgi:hypothetical protein
MQVLGFSYIQNVITTGPTAWDEGRLGSLQWQAKKINSQQKGNAAQN